jgi:chemotaxis protein MotB
MKVMNLIAMSVCGLLVAGCVTKGTHGQTVAELEETRKASAKAATDFDTLKKQSAAQIAALEEEKSKVANELMSAQNAAIKAQQDLDRVNKNLDTALTDRKELEEESKRLRADTSESQRASGELRRERDLLQAKTEDIERRLEAAQQELGNHAKALRDATAHIAVLGQEKERQGKALVEAQSRTQDLETKLQGGQATIAGLQDEKQKLIVRVTAATDELAKVQKQVGELHIISTHAEDLDARLSQREQEIARLQKRAGELETEAARAKDLEIRLSERDTDIGRLRQGGEMLAAEKQRLERERAEKEVEVQRLTKTQEDLAKSLQAEIAKGDITIKQVRDRLTINMVDRILFDSGKAQIKPAGLKVLKQVSDVLKNINEKQIRIEGHTDNVPIKGKLKDRYPSNWELSTARATSVVRYVVEEGGVNSGNLEAVGYADTRPVAENDTEDGRAVNRRIEIVLYPKDLSAIAK